MRYWWVNQNQTFEQEFQGGFLWSPKRKQNGDVNPFYENMRVVAPGDLILSFKDKKIPAAGIATSHCYECPKPEEFGSTGPNWSQIGWKVEVKYQPLINTIFPAEHMGMLRSLLPDRYSPLQATGRGNQGVYLTELSSELAHALGQLIGSEFPNLMMASSMVKEHQEFTMDRSNESIAQWEEYLRASVEADDSVADTEKRAIVLARRGQGRFKESVCRFECRCRVTGVTRIEHLRASHIKPWRDCPTNEERLDGENGFLLTPSIDHLFDRGFISFEDNGRVIVSPVADRGSLERMGVTASPSSNVGNFTEGQQRYLEYHRDSVFLDRVR